MLYLQSLIRIILIMTYSFYHNPIFAIAQCTNFRQVYCSDGKNRYRLHLATFWRKFWDLDQIPVYKEQKDCLPRCPACVTLRDKCYQLLQKKDLHLTGVVTPVIDGADSWPCVSSWQITLNPNRVLSDLKPWRIILN